MRQVIGFLQISGAPLLAVLSVATIAPMKCPICKKEFVAIRVDAQYCGVNCRSQAYRMRLRMAARREKDGEPESDPKANRSQKRAELLTSATGSGKSPRVALEQQVFSQAPPGAVRYRLVLGVEQKSHREVMAPENSAWNLMPFEAPDDLRLLHGCTYRIVWLDRDGDSVRPLEWVPIPSLHFFLGEPDAEISAEQVERRYQAQTVMQLRQQVELLEQRQERMRQKLRAQKRKMRTWKLRASGRIAELKLMHKEDSFEKVVWDWAPVVALLLGLRWLNQSNETADSPATSSIKTPTVKAPKRSTPNSSSLLDLLPSPSRVHPLQHSLAMLSSLIESEESQPTKKELSQMSKQALWSRIGTWLERAKLATPSRSAEAPCASDWQPVCQVSDATTALRFLSETLTEEESAKTLSACSQTLLKEGERIDKRLHSWLSQHDLTGPQSPQDWTELRGLSTDLANILRDTPPPSGDGFAQAIHDALNAIRIRIMDAIGEPLAAGEPHKTAAIPDLRTMGLFHGKEFLGRYVKQLLRRREDIRELRANRPHRSPRIRSAADKKLRDSSTETTPRPGTSAQRDREDGNMPIDQLIGQFAAAVAERPDLVEQLTSELNAHGHGDPGEGKSSGLEAILGSLDPAHRQQILDAVRLAQKRPKADSQSN